MNKEKLKGYLDKTKETLGKVSKKIWILIGVILAVLVIGVVVFLNTRPYSPLISGASDDETSTVISWLGEQGIKDYKMDGPGTILVPSDQATALKTRLLQEQYTNSNSPWQGYFERVDALSTMKDREVAALDALTQQLEDMIRGFDNVRDAEVVINTGEDHRYVLDTNNVVNASATVSLTMEQGKLLTAEQAQAIRYLIAKGVAGLNVSEVSISDKKGNIYDGLTTGGTADSVDSTALALQTEQWWANQIRSQIEQQLYKMYLEENVAVSVRCTVELGNKTTNDYQVHLPEFAQDGSTNGAGIIGKRYYQYQVRVGDDVAAGGLVGTPSNADLPTYVEEGESLADALARLVGEGNIEYDNPKTQTTMIITAATLKDVTVSVSINTEPESGPISVDEERMIHHVAAAAGIQAPLELPDGVTEADYLARHISVMGTPFVKPVLPTPELTFLETLNAMGIPTWVLFAAIGGLLLFVIILVTVILLVRRGKKKKQEEEQRAVEELLSTAMPGQTVVMGADGQPVTVTIGPDGQPVETPVQLDEDGNPVTGADVMDLHTERSMELRQNIRDYVDENMEVAALLLKSWLKEDVDNG